MIKSSCQISSFLQYFSLTSSSYPQVQQRIPSLQPGTCRHVPFAISIIVRYIHTRFLHIIASNTSKVLFTLKVLKSALYKSCLCTDTVLDGTWYTVSSTEAKSLLIQPPRHSQHSRIFITVSNEAISLLIQPPRPSQYIRIFNDRMYKIVFVINLSTAREQSQIYSQQ